MTFLRRLFITLGVIFVAYAAVFVCAYIFMSAGTSPFIHYQF